MIRQVRNKLRDLLGFAGDIDTNCPSGIIVDGAVYALGDEPPRASGQIIIGPPQS